MQIESITYLRNVRGLLSSQGTVQVGGHIRWVEKSARQEQGARRACIQEVDINP